MKAAFIRAISYYLPETVLTNEEINRKFPEWTVDKISSKTGIYERRIAGPDESAGDMAVSVSGMLFTEHGIRPEEIDFLLLCTQSPDYFLPTTACIVQDRLGLPKDTGALDFNLGCSGFVYGLSLAKALVVSGMAKNVLLVTAETYSKFIHPNDKGNRTIFGDAATATVVSETGFAEIGDFTFGTDGSGWEQLIVRNGAVKNRHAKGSDVYDGEVFQKNDDNLFMNGNAIFNFTATVVPELVQKTLVANHLTPAGIDAYIFHQANRYMLSYIRKKMEIPEDKFFLFMEKTGNTVSSTIPIALHEYMRTRGNQPSTVLLAGFGVGLSWGGTVLKVGN
jgi:3-oxoacyl-[acyl-carrier-protein] synthase III